MNSFSLQVVNTVSAVNLSYLEKHQDGGYTNDEGTEVNNMPKLPELGRESSESVLLSPGDYSLSLCPMAS